LARLGERVKRQESLVALAEKVDNVLQHWDQLGIIEKRAVAQIFIDRIVITPTEKSRVADAKIHWHDESIDEFVLPYSAQSWTLWLPSEVDTLKKLLEQSAPQVEISAALPNRN